MFINNDNSYHLHEYFMSFLSKCNLHLSEHFIIWGVRQWVICNNSKEDAIPLLNKIYSTKNVQKLTVSINNFMCTFSRNKEIDIYCLCHNELSYSEINILKSIYLAQNGYDVECIRCISRFILEKEKIAFENIISISSTLLCKNYIIPSRNEYLLNCSEGKYRFH